MALITVIIPMYNKAGCVGRAIRSILAQTFTDFKLIIVDDGSTDDGVSQVRCFEDERIELIQQANAGPGAARNAGIRAAQTEYVSFLDADDEWYPWFLQNSLDAMKEYEVELTASTFYRTPENIDMRFSLAQKGCTPGKISIDGTETAVEASCILSCPHAFNVLMTKELADKYEGFYEKDRCVFGEDQTFFMRILMNEPMAVVTPSSVRHHTEDSQLGTVDVNRPVQPYLSEPSTVMSYCPENKKRLFESLLNLRALRTACHMLQRGQRKLAIELVRKFPESIEHKKMHRKVRCKIALGPIYPVYLLFKKLVIVPLRKYIGLIGKDEQECMPLMPYEQDDNDKR